MRSQVFCHGFIVMFPQGVSVISLCLQYLLGKACSTFYVMQATLAKFCLHAGNMKIITQNEARTSISKLCIIVPVYLSMHHVQ